MFYAANYLRLMLFLLMLTLYLRPIAVIGAMALAITTYYNITAITQRHQQQHANEQQSNGTLGPALAAATWIVVVFTKCVPILLLGLCIGCIAVLVHASLRPSPSEQRTYTATPLLASVGGGNGRGRRRSPPLSYVLRDVLFAHRYTINPQEGIDPRLVFRQLWDAGGRWAAYKTTQLRRWTVYYGLAALDFLKNPSIPLRFLSSSPPSSANSGGRDGAAPTTTTFTTSSGWT